MGKETMAGLACPRRRPTVTPGAAVALGQLVRTVSRCKQVMEATASLLLLPERLCITRVVAAVDGVVWALLELAVWVAAAPEAQALTGHRG